MVTGRPITKGEVRLDGLTKAFGDVVAVDRVSAEIGAGTFFTLLGPSGSGKTTTLSMIAGFVHPTEGEIFVSGAPMSGLPPQKRNLGMVFQDYAVFPHLTVFDNVAFPLQVRHVRPAEIRQRVGEMLELVQLSGLDNRLPRQLSGGQHQRVALARALGFRPQVLLMDEPLGALDRKLRVHMQAEIKNIQRRLNVTVIYVTHDQEEALTMSDRVAVMRAGHIEQLGTPAQLYEAPVNRFVADFLGESNFLEGIVVQVTGSDRYLVQAGDGLQFWAIAATQMRIGDTAIGAVRPEKFVVGKGTREDLNSCEGFVEEAIYAGDSTRYRLRIGANVVSIRVQNNRLTSCPYSPGERIIVSWDAADTRLFCAEKS